MADGIPGVDIDPPSGDGPTFQDNTFLGVEDDYVAPYLSRRTTNVADRAEREEREAISGLGGRTVSLPSVSTFGGRRYRGRGRATAITGYTPAGVLPIYREQDTYTIFQRMPVPLRAEIELQLVEAGLLDPDDVRGGDVWSLEAQKAMRVVMTTANQQGLSWHESLRLYRANPPASMDDDGGDVPRFVAPPYLAPDYDALTGDVRALFRNRLGRDPLDYELSLLAEQMQADYRKAYDVQVAAQRADFDAQVAGGDGGGTFQSVDPVASMQAEFERRYGPEMARLEEIEDVAESQAAVIGSAAMTRGGDA